LGGTAYDYNGVMQVTWSNNRGGSGSCSGTANWSCNSIALQNGDNAITVTASDAASNSGTGVLTVSYTPPTPQPTTMSYSASSGFAGIDSYLITVGNGAGMTVDVKYDFTFWNTTSVYYDLIDTMGPMNGSGQMTRYLSHNAGPGTYTVTAIKNNLNSEWVPITPLSFTIRPAKPTGFGVSPTVASTNDTITLSVANGQDQLILLDFYWSIYGSEVQLPIAINSYGLAYMSGMPPSYWYFIALRNALDEGWDAWAYYPAELTIY
jgi:hypothetical protein